MLESLKRTVLSRGPFAQVPIGGWIRSRTFWHYFDERLRSQNPRRVLDAGCGPGGYTLELAKRLPNAEVVGLDLLSQPSWEQHGLQNLSFRQQDLCTLNEPDSYDLIVSIDSLEHIPDNKSVMRAFHRSLRPGGILYLAMPRGDDTYLPKKWFADREQWLHDEHIGEEYGLGELQDVLRQIGFSIGFARHTFTVWGRLSWELSYVLKGNPLASATRVLNTPLFKALGLMDLHFPLGSGHNLIIAERTS